VAEMEATMQVPKEASQILASGRPFVVPLATNQMQVTVEEAQN
jgi:hypothetical protein